MSSLSSPMDFGLFLSSALLCLSYKKLTKMAVTAGKDSEEQTIKDQKIVAVNYHFTRQCNFACGFCFHTAKTSHEKQAPKRSILQEASHSFQPTKTCLEKW